VALAQRQGRGREKWSSQWATQLLQQQVVQEEGPVQQVCAGTPLAPSTHYLQPGQGRTEGMSGSVVYSLSQPR
jgi:hypothetical protein